MLCPCHLCHAPKHLIKHFVLGIISLNEARGTILSLNHIYNYARSFSFVHFALKLKDLVGHRRGVLHMLPAGTPARVSLSTRLTDLYPQLIFFDDGKNPRWIGSWRNGCK
jgi:hypothetical protein